MHHPRSGTSWPLVAGLVALALAADAKAQAARGMGMEQAVREDHEELLRRIREREQQGQILAATCPYTVTPEGFFLPKTVTGTNWNEPVRIMTPCMYDPQGPDLPLLVVWNGYGNTPNGFVNTDPMHGLLTEANERGWLAIMVTGLDDKSLGCVDPIPTQTNVMAAIQYMLDNYPVDDERIYLMGWSAGAGAAASFAARHLDPNAPMIAALALNDGSFDLIDAYTKEVAAYKTATDLRFGGPPSNASFTFNYERAETERTDALLNVIEARSQIRNLQHVPAFHVYPSNDTVLYLPAQNQKFATELAAEGGTIVSQVVATGSPTHSWTLLNPDATFDFLQTQSVERTPAEFQITADRAATYYWATLTQRQPGNFSTFEVEADEPARELRIVGLDNVGTLLLAPPPGVFALGTHFRIEWESNDPSSTTLRIDGVPQAPTYVLSGTSLFKNWTYNAATDRLELAVAPGSTGFEVRFDDFDGSVTAPATAKINTTVNFQFAAPGGSSSYIALFGVSEGVLPLSLVDPGDDRNILLGFAPLPVMLVSTLGGGGTATLPLFVPNDVSLIGKSLRCQFVTFPGGTQIIDVVSNRHDVSIVP